MKKAIFLVFVSVFLLGKGVEVSCQHHTAGQSAIGSRQNSVAVADDLESGGLTAESGLHCVGDDALVLRDAGDVHQRRSQVDRIGMQVQLGKTHSVRLSGTTGNLVYRAVEPRAEQSPF